MNHAESFFDKSFSFFCYYCLTNAGGDSFPLPPSTSTSKKTFCPESCSHIIEDPVKNSIEFTWKIRFLYFMQISAETNVLLYTNTIKIWALRVKLLSLAQAQIFYCNHRTITNLACTKILWGSLNSWDSSILREKCAHRNFWERQKMWIATHFIYVWFYAVI